MKQNNTQTGVIIDIIEPLENSILIDVVTDKFDYLGVFSLN